MALSEIQSNDQATALDTADPFDLRLGVRRVNRQRVTLVRDKSGAWSCGCGEGEKFEGEDEARFTS
jgi:hypothetical protein